MRFLSLLVFASFPLYGGTDSAPFDEKIGPLLKARCGECHSEEKKTSGFSIATLESVTAGGNKHGRAIVEGFPGQSPLVKLLRGQVQPQMPLGAPLAEVDIASIESWIRGLNPDQAPKLKSGAWLWPFQRPVTPPVPQVRNQAWVRNPIDAFILQKLEQQKLPPAPPASMRTLARRLYFDLIGLPPSPEELNTFLEDRSPGAVEKLIDKLLEDPRYGERWARPWLDLVRYSESNGLEGDPEIGNDIAYGNVWRYRDWVIDAFNSDLPYDQFVTQQIAGGDEKSRTRDRYTPGMRGYVPAVFLRVGPWSLYDNLVSIENRQTYLDEITTTTGSVFLGLTIGCARCHDHKYDPIPSKDYYRLQSLFNAVKVDDIEVPFRDPAMRERAAQKVKEYTERLANGPERQEFEEYSRQLLNKLQAAKREQSKAAKLTMEDLRLELHRKDQKIFTAGEQLKHADLTQDAARTKEPEEAQALDEFERQLLTKLEAGYARGVVNPLGRFDELTISDLRKELPEREAPPKLFTVAERDRFYGLSYKVEVLEHRLRRWKPMVATVVNVPGPPTGPDIPPTRILVRGDVYRPGEVVEPGFPSAITGDSKPAALEIDLFRQFPTRGRRTTLAKWLTSPDNPLTARVMMNRIWQHHFGRGIVGTPNDFGKNGERPTHPELLDWLANRFVEEKWSVKAMHRLILTSNTYRQAPDNPAVTGADPDNRLLWRYNRRRLEAEVIRDSILFFSGRLNLERGGPSVFPPLPNEVADLGRAVPIGGLMWEPNENEADGRRRSIYNFQRRSLPLPMMANFDAPVFNESCERRIATTTTLQALTMMNGQLVNEEARHLAARVTGEVGQDRATQVRRIFEIVFNRPPSAVEVDRFSNFRGSLDGIARVLLNANEAFYME